MPIPFFGRLSIFATKIHYFYISSRRNNPADARYVWRGVQLPLEGDMWDEQVSSAKELLWLILYGDERPDMPR
jgi:hypothetical protein